MFVGQKELTLILFVLARSIGSVALKKTKDGKLPHHFNFFTINYNEVCFYFIDRVYSSR